MYTLERVHLSFTNETLKPRKGIPGAGKGQTYATTLPRVFVSLGCRAGGKDIPDSAWGLLGSDRKPNV